MATTTRTSPAALSEREALDLVILEALAEPVGRGDRSPAAVARHVHREPVDVTAACRRLEAEQMLERWMGLRPTRAGFSRLADLHRRRP